MQFSGGSLVQSLSQDYNPVSPGLQSSQGSLGVVLGALKRTHGSCGCWLEITLSCHMDLSISHSQHGRWLSSKWASMLVTQSYPTLCYSTDCSPPVSSVHGIPREYWSGLPFPTPGKASKGESKRKRERQKLESSVTCFWEQHRVIFTLFNL